VAALQRIRAALIGVSVRLPDHLLDRYPELAGARYRRGGLPPRVGGWALGLASVAGITLWRTVFLAPHVPFSAELLLHELAHVRQFEESRAFPVRYLWECARVGYRRNRFEVAAQRYASLRLRDAGYSPFSGT